MANWIDDPQGREEVEKVTQELKLPILKPNAKGKFRPWLTEVWGKIEDYLINLKNIANSKEPLITKKTGFNLDKTNLTENDSNKLFTARGALDLFNTLTTNFTNAVNSAKEYFRTELVKKIDKTSKSDAVNSASSETIATSKAVKTAYDKAEAAIPIIDNTVVTNLNTVKGTKFFMVNGGSVTGIPTDSSFSSGDFNVVQFDSQEQRVQIIFNNYGVPFLRTNDASRNQENYENAWGGWYKIWNERDFNPDNKLNISDAWKQQAKIIGNITTPIDLNNIFEPGMYVSNNSSNKFINCPLGNNAAFILYVETPTPDVPDKYSIQTFFDFISNKIIRRVKVDYVWRNFERIDALSVNWNNLPNKPSVFPPSTHTHSWAELNGKPNFVNVTDSTSTTDFATPRSVKLAYDRGSAALTEAQKKENTFSKNTAFNKNFGTTAGTVLEGNKIDQITGKTYGGILNTAGAKTAGKTYFDNNTKKLFLCKNNNSDTSANVNNYIALDNNSLLDRLENLINFKTKVINTRNYSGQYTFDTKTFLIGVHINVYDNRNNTSTSSIKWIPKQNGTWYAVEGYADYITEGFEFLITGNSASIKYVGNDAAQLVAIYELKIN